MKFSVIIPVYNIAPFIRKCVESVLYAEKVVQTLDSSFLCEIICIDDGSTDGSSAILDEIGGQGVTVIHQKNAGVSSARNAALEIANGDYICFVDGDDAVEQDYFAVLLPVVKTASPSIIRFGHYSVSRNMAMNGVRVATLSDRSEAARAFNDFFGSTWAWNACYSSKVVKTNRFERIPNGEDILFAGECFCDATTVAFLDAQIYHYLIRPGSAVHTISLRHLLSICDMSRLYLRKIRTWAIQHGVRTYFDRKLRVDLAYSFLQKIDSLPADDAKKAWNSFFNTMKDCRWSIASSLVAGSKSRILAILFYRFGIGIKSKLLTMPGVRRAWERIR